MFGIKIKNSEWEKVLLILLKDKAEIWRPDVVYQAILTDLSPKEAILFQKQTNSPLLLLGHTYPHFPCLNLPFSLAELEACLAHFFPSYENTFFIWDSAHRILTNKQTNQPLVLTEKEAHLIDFLALQPNHTATVKELLHHVWSYKPDAETHTVESTIHTLRQKLGKHKQHLILSEKDTYHLL